jgi:DNA-binding NarL/FixJ family response regulator
MIVKTLIADRERIFLDGLELLLTSGEQYFYRVIGQTNSSQAILDRIEQSEVDLLITDINLGDNESSDFIKQIKKKSPEIKICVLSSYVADKFVRKAFINGTDAFVSKYDSAKVLFKALAVIAGGKTFMSEGLQMTPSINQTKGERTTQNSFVDNFQLIEKLTKREMEILQQIAQAKSNIQIGKELFISDQTVAVHRKNILRKLSLNSTNELIKFSYDNGLV